MHRPKLRVRAASSLPTVSHLRTALHYASALALGLACGSDRGGDTPTTDGNTETQSSGNQGVDAPDAGGAPSEDLETGESPADPGELRQAAAAAGKLLGTAVDTTPLAGDAEYASTLASEFDYVTPENAAKWGPLEPSDDNYNWAPLDAIVEAAEANGQAVKGHTLVWHQQAPGWLDALSADELRTAMREHITTTLDRYRGRIRAWDVVNEAVDTNTASGYTDSVFYRALGESYIEDAFRFAREADPSVLLYYNEVGIERLGTKSDFTYAMLQDLVERGVPIDGIGLQSHVSNHRYPSLSNLRANIQRFAELGLSVNISEADVRTNFMPGDDVARFFAQRIAFQQIVGACVVEPACEGVTLWGFTDGYTWIADDRPLIFDESYQPKPGYQGVLDGLRGQLPVAGDNILNNARFEAGAEGWAASAGELAVEEDPDVEGDALCLSGRTDAADGLVQTELLGALQGGGPHVFTAMVKTRGGEGTVQPVLRIQEEGVSGVRELNMGNRGAIEAEWLELSGYFGLGYDAAPASIELIVNGVPEGVDLCVADVQIRPLSAE